MGDMTGMEIGNYRIEGKIGEGGMGTVYRAVEISLDRPVAVKVLNADLARNPDIVERFRSEARAQANLNHTNVAILYTFLLHAGDAMMVMEYLEGETFQQMLERRGPINSAEAVHLFKQALLGIGAAHRIGIVHRDIKPGNLMLSKSGIVKVMDFGIARVASERRLTRTGMQVGTVLYMSPEQVKGGRVDVRSDIYSLGVTLYEMLTAHVPFAAESDIQILFAHISTPPPLPSHFCPDVPKGIEKIVLKALEKNPDDRFQTVDEFGAALEHPERWEDYQTHTIAQDAVSEAAVAAPAATAAAVTLAPVVNPAPVQPAAPKPLRPLRPEWLMVVAAAGILLVALAGSAIVAYRLWPRPQAAPVAVTVSKNGATGVTPSPRPGGAMQPLVIGRAPQNGSNPPPPAPEPVAGTATAAKTSLAKATPERDETLHGGSARPARPAAPVAQTEAPGAQPDRVAEATTGTPSVSPAPVMQQLVIPGSTALTLRTTGPIDGEVARPGQTFAASVDTPVVVNGKVALPQHADALVRLVEAHRKGRFRGSAKLVLALDSFTVGGKHYSVNATPVDVTGGSGGPRTGKLAVAGGAVGAAVGGVVRGGKEVVEGALEAGGARAATLTGDKGLTLPAESRLTFQLAAPVTVTVQ